MAAIFINRDLVFVLAIPASKLGKFCEFERFFNRRILSCKRRRDESKNLCAFFGSLRNQIIKEDDDHSTTSSDQENEVIYDDDDDFDHENIQTNSRLLTYS